MEGVNISVLLNGNLLQAQGLARFTILSSGKHYLIYSFNEKSLQGGEEFNRVYVSETGDQNTQFVDITQEEWENIKPIMSALSKPDATIPVNIQLTKLQPTQYYVGNYRKIALTDAYVADMIKNQKNNEPSENVVLPAGNTQFFDQSVIQPQEEVVETKDEPAIPNAFGMSVPQEEVTPTALVEEPSASAQVIIKNEELNPDAIRQEVINSLIKVINYCDGDMNKFNELLTGAGALTKEETIVETPKTVGEVHEEYPEPQTSIIDINNIPVVNQESTVEENVLHEETFEPTTPSMPVDTMAGTMTTPEVNEPQQEIVQEVEIPQMVEQPVAQEVVEQPQLKTETVEQPTFVEPVQSITQEVIEQPTTIEQVQPVEQVVEQPTMVESIPVEQPGFIEQPVTPVEPQAFVQPVEPVQPQTFEQPTMLESTPVVETPTIQQFVEQVQPVQEVQQPIIQQPIETPNTLGVPTIIGVDDNPQQDMSFIDAGPVIMPAGQENVQSQGLPGDNGAKILEKVA